MKRLVSTILLLQGSFSAYAGHVHDDWDPGQELGDPRCFAAGNPIHAGMGNKFQELVVYRGVGTNPLEFVWNYNSELLGTDVWRNNLQRQVVPIETGGGYSGFDYYERDGGYSEVLFSTLIPSAPSCSTGAGTVSRSQITPGGRLKILATTATGQGCEILSSVKLYHPEGHVENYAFDSQGTWSGGASRLSYVEFNNGERHTYSYDEVLRRLTVQHSNGQSMVVSFTAKQAEQGSIVLLPTQLQAGSLSWTFQYDEYQIDSSTNSRSQILKSIDGPGGSSNSFTFVTQIESANLPSPVLKVMLTDRYINGVHAAGWVFNSNKRAFRSYHGPRPSSDYQGSSFFDDSQYGAVELSFEDYGTLITDSLGRQTTQDYSIHEGYQGRKKTVLEQVNGFGSTNCLPTNSSLTYDEFWRPIEVNEYSIGRRKLEYTTGASSRGRLKKVTDAFASGLDKSITYQYADEDRNLVLKVVEGTRTVEFDYFPNGRVREQRIKDTSNRSVPYSTNGVTQRTSYSYQYYDAEQRRLRSMVVDGPRNDVADLTTFEYDLRGRLTRIINALGQVTSFEDFNEWDVPQRIVDENQAVTTLVYQSGFSGPLVTEVKKGTSPPWSASYNAFELPAVVSYPTGLTLEYSYRTMDAESLYSVRNNLGEQVDVNRSDDPISQTRQVSRSVLANDGSAEPRATFSEVHDALGRLYKSLSANGIVSQYMYDQRNKVIQKTTQGVDSYGVLTTEADSFDYDERGRTTSHGDNSRLTIFGYTPLDQLNLVTDANSRSTRHVLDSFGNTIQTVSPDSGKTIRYFDLANNLIESVDAEGIVTRYTYDALNRLTLISYPGDPTENVGLFYDGDSPSQNGIGRLTQTTGPGGSSTFFYDSEGNLSAKTWSFGNHQYHYGYTYSGGLLRSTTYPSGSTVNHHYDGAGRLVGSNWSAGQESGPLFSNAEYEPFGPVASFTFGNGLVQSVTRDSQFRPTGLKSSTVFDLTYSYDDFGNLVSVVDELDVARSESFKYSIFGELRRALGPYGVLEFEYDDVGNRSGLTVNGLHHGYDHNTAGKLTRVFDYTNWQLIDRFQYLKNGDTKLLGEASIQMNKAGNIRSIVKAGATTSYLYDHVGLRVHKSSGNVLYHYDSSGKLVAESDSSTGVISREYHYFGDSVVAVRELNSGAPQAFEDFHFVHSNIIGAPVAITDAQGQQVWSANYRPFGSAEVVAEDFVFNLRMPGHYYDEESELHYNWNRYYSPKHGRFLQSDPIGLQGGVNTYLYALGNPVTNTDPDGLRTRQNPWNAFRSQMKGRGLSRTEIQQRYWRQVANQQQARLDAMGAGNVDMRDALGNWIDLSSIEPGSVTCDAVSGCWIVVSECSCGRGDPSVSEILRGIQRHQDAGVCRPPNAGAQRDHRVGPTMSDDPNCTCREVRQPINMT